MSRCHINGSAMQDAKGSRVTDLVIDGKGESNHGSFYEFRGRNQSVSGQLIFSHRTLQQCQKRPVAYCHLTVQQVDLTKVHPLVPRGQ